MKNIVAVLTLLLFGNLSAYGQSQPESLNDSALVLLQDPFSSPDLHDSIKPTFFLQFPDLYFYLKTHQLNFNAQEGGFPAPFSTSSMLVPTSALPLFSKSYYNSNSLNAGHQCLLASKPFSFIQYWQAGPSDDVFQSLKLIHSQRFGKNMFAGFSGSSINSKGFIERQESKLYDFSIWSKFENQKYLLFINAFALSSKNQENGGLVNDSLFINKEYDMPRYDCEVQLSDAQTIISGKSLNILNVFRMNHDSTIVTKEYQWETGITQASRNFTYGGSNLAFFQNLAFDSIINQDSTNYIQFKTKATYKLSKADKPILNEVTLSLNYQLDRFSMVDTFVDHSVDVSALMDIWSDRKSKLIFKGNFVLLGRRTNDFYLSAVFSSLRAHSLKLGISASETSRDWFLLHYLSSYYKMDGLEKEANFNAYFDVNLNHEQIHLSLNSGLVTNLGYFNQDATYTQLDRSVLYSEASLNYTLKRNSFEWRSDFFLQYSNESLIGFPAWMIHSKISIKAPIFRRKAHFYFGFEGWVNGANYLPFYNPVGGYYGQQKIFRQEPYPVINVFMLFEVKTAQILLQFENLGGVFYDTNYMSAYMYPFRTPRFGVGINWYAFD